MSKVPLLDSEEKFRAWKEGFRALLKKCGKQQQEVAINMARLVYDSSDDAQERTFISSLSRFVNGRDSAFPGWFYKESTRLLPLAKAMGFSSTEPLWNLLHEVTQEKRATNAWHPAFPQENIHIPIHISGAPLEQSIEKIIAYARRNTGEIQIVLYGVWGAGKKTLMEKITRLLEQEHPSLVQRISFSPLLRRPVLSTTPFMFEVGSWGWEEFRALYQALEDALVPIQKERAQQFLQHIHAILPPISLGANHSIHFFRMILDTPFQKTQKRMFKSIYSTCGNAICREVLPFLHFLSKSGVSFGVWYIKSVMNMEDCVQKSSRQLWIELLPKQRVSIVQKHCKSSKNWSGHPKKKEQKL